MTTLHRFLACLGLFAANVVTAASDANAPRQYLDEETGATVVFVGRPLVFFRERLPGAVNATGPRDYVTLAAAAVDHTGKYTYLLIGYFWSVGGPAPDDSACFGREHLILQLGDRRIELVPFDGSARDAGISEPIHRPWSDAKSSVYASDLGSLSLVAESSHPVLYCGVEKAPLKYELLEDRLPALKELVRYLSH